MLTKILAGGFVLIMLGATVMGAITLFTDRAGTNEHVRYNARGQAAVGDPIIGGRGGQGAGQGRGRVSPETDRPRGSAPEAAPQSGGRGQRIGRGQGTGSEYVPTSIAQETIEGIVVETTELVLETDSGETVQVGLGPSHYRDSQGFVLSIGDKAQVSGYWEDGEFKAAQVTNLDTGESIILRDASGRPMWAGQGRGQNRG
jgi:hypothetical protein